MRVILLRNYDGHTYLKVSKFIDNHRKEIESKITSVGADHLVACERIILAIKDKRKDKFKR